jgi:2-methylisocitrate lyase-like PEP mutase family enzyme
MEGQHLALAQLQQIRADVLCSRVIALQPGLPDAHAARAHRPVDKIADALTVVGRLVEVDFERSCYGGALVAALTAATYSTTWDLWTTNDD